MEILNQIQKFGVEVKLECEDQLRLVGSAGLPNQKQAELLQLVKAHKAELIRELRNRKPAWCTKT